MATATKLEIRSYTKHDSGWEYNGDGWEADELTTDGDWSAYAPGEPCLLRAFNDDGEQVGELEFVPNPK